MVHSVSEPDSAECRGKRAKRRNARFVDNGRTWLRMRLSTGSQHSNWGSLASSWPR